MFLRACPSSISSLRRDGPATIGTSASMATHRAIDQVAGKKLKFAVLVTGNSAPEIEKEFGDYGQLYKDLLADPDLDEEWHVFYPVNDHFPTDDDLKGFKVLPPAVQHAFHMSSSQKSETTTMWLCAGAGHHLDREQA